MISSWVFVATSLIYIGGLFIVATYGDRRASAAPRRPRPTIYALSIGVYCTSWTFFGSVGFATTGGLEFLAIYLGPMIAFLVFFRLWRRITRLAKAERITTVAHFLSARYGKSPSVAAVVTIIALIGTIPYIALQLKAVSSALTTVGYNPSIAFDVPMLAPFGDIALWIALVMGVFAVLFGTRHADATEHQEGLMLSIAAESVVKLVALTAVGIFVCFLLFASPFELLAVAREGGDLWNQTVGATSWSRFLVLTLISFSMAFLLPRQFHVSVTENNSPGEISRATWLFPVYLVLINLFVMPIALAGMALLGPTVDPDTFVLALPKKFGGDVFALIAFIGGLSAATAMVIVAQIALAIMIGNDIVLPLLLQRRALQDRQVNMQGLVLAVRRLSIIAVMGLAYIFYLTAGDGSALASIGLLSFAAFAQLAPAFFLGLFWRGGSARGSIAGMLAGVSVWAYTLLVPVLAKSGILPLAILDEGLFGWTLLRPESLFGLAIDPYLHGVFWSVSVNLLTIFGVSLARPLQPVERLQAQIFIPSGEMAPSRSSLHFWQTKVTASELQDTVARYLGRERTQRSFERFSQDRPERLPAHHPADIETVRFAEQLLASAIGAASARLVLSLLLRRQDASTQGAIQLLDDATEALQYNRDLLQTALDQVAQGICVFDGDFRLICWNRQFREHLDLPTSYGQVGTTLSAIVQHLADSGEFGDENRDTRRQDLLTRLISGEETFSVKLMRSEMVLEVRTSKMPTGGLVATFSDITERVMAEQALAMANENLERRVRERTNELTEVNQALRMANAEAEQANASKTRFLAAASHDILQPLNAARLYTSSLVERLETSENSGLIRNVEASLSSVEDILAAILDISRLDTATFKPEVSAFPLGDVLDQLRLEHEVMASDKGLDLRFIPTSVEVRSDRRLLRRLLQNLISNAIKYTPSGRVLVGVRRSKGEVKIEVHDTGLGISTADQVSIFKEFNRLDEGVSHAAGLGLGLSIVERIKTVLKHDLILKSEPGMGSMFAVSVPALPVGLSVEKLRDKHPPRLVGQLDGLLVGCLDNEQSIIQGMETLLTGWGVEVVIGQTAAELANGIKKRGRRPDVLLVDFHLDQGTGLDAINQLRWQYGSDIPAMLITADRTAGVRQDASERSIGVLNKPLKPAALRAYLAQVTPLGAAAE